MKRVYCIHTMITNKQELLCYLGIDSIEAAENLQWDKSNPQYLFVSEHVFFDGKCFADFYRFRKITDIIRIYIAGECIAPDMNIFDYACVFDRSLTNGDRIIRIPPQIMHKRSIFQEFNAFTREKANIALEEKEGFCCFLYSNSDAHPIRDRIFFSLSKYKKVDSLGRHLRNVSPKTQDKKGDWRAESITIKSKYKFSIAAENAKYDGYTSEKIMTSFQAHTIPIYWGNPSIKEEFNSNAFINVDDYASLEELVEAIKEIDENDELWMKMICEPWQTNEQILVSKKERADYYSFWDNVFGQSIQHAMRIPKGTYPNRYRLFYYRISWLYFLRMLVYKMKRKIKC